MLLAVRALRAIGFWREPQYEWRADIRKHVYLGWAPGWTAYPQAIVDALGPCKPDPNVLSYLRSAVVFETYRGFSHCRFECGVANQEMGHREFTDGIWVWPEGLVHYVDKHDLPLPAEFLETIDQHSGQAAAVDVNSDAPIDCDFWESWFTKVTSGHG